MKATALKYAREYAHNSMVKNTKQMIVSTTKILSSSLWVATSRMSSPKSAHMVMTLMKIVPSIPSVNHNINAFTC
eukprot:5027001-Pyramimonas_sp.AAC.1